MRIATVIAVVALVAVAVAVAFGLLDRRPPPIRALAVPVTIHFAGRAEIWVDGDSAGAFVDSTRLPLAPGRHRLEVRDGPRVLRRQVLVLDGTAPLFDFGN